MRTDLFDFELPEERIALYPAEPRDAARMLVVEPQAGDGAETLGDCGVREIVDYLRPGDILVLNDTRVVPAALEGLRWRGESAARVHINLVKQLDEQSWRAFARPGKRLSVGDVIQFGENGRVCSLGELSARVIGKTGDGQVELVFSLSGDFLSDALGELGEMPLPPYIEARRAAGAGDRETYQTIYARRDGAVAAPTAGFHFTPELFAALDEKGVERAFVTLHVGAGTFLPVKADDTSEHDMHSEWCTIDAETATRLNRARARGGRIVAVGTTSLRVLESAAGADGEIRPFEGETDIFITPGYRFKAVDVLVTNFHLPRSTLVMLVAAFCGLETIKAAYRHAIAGGYRFYSYGDACLLFRRGDAGAA